MDEIAGQRGSSLASVVREAVDLYIAEGPLDPTSALKRTFGAAPDAAAPDRGDWDARLHRLNAAE